ncbi:colicin immunity domain-containing protein [Halobacteria archaeon HArc-gm2]|nr:colicin immunity domain-containing protein [Halobacteria archaeon HArc-gm2]
MDDQIAEMYLELIRSYTDGRMTAKEFMHEYIDAFKHVAHEPPTDERYDVVESLFFACDEYCDDPELDVTFSIGEDQFFEEAAYARRDLEALLNESEDSESAE